MTTREEVKLINFIQETDQLVNSDQLIFFGGTFHPWHQGHSYCIKLAPKNIPIIVMPDQNPHKEVQDGDTRLSSLTDIQNELKNINAQTHLFKGFFDLDSLNPTINWIEELNKHYPDKDLSLLMGYDSFRNILTWDDSDKLLSSLYCLYVASREEVPADRNQFEQIILKKYPKLKVQFLGNHPFEGLSSTKIRQELQRSE